MLHQSKGKWADTRATTNLLELGHNCNNSWRLCKRKSEKSVEGRLKSRHRLSNKEHGNRQFWASRGITILANKATPWATYEAERGWVHGRIDTSSLRRKERKLLFSRLDDARSNQKEMRYKNPPLQKSGGRCGHTPSTIFD